ncbi:hypothetical protein HF313_22870 [Massilia atriviolacea]|uniref:Uncharacterized protein n=1 Tax=Massilia atriviolacea TaxID=2495579 RepID=A0A430HCL7_9BURK|nr:hypothetical protein [Massilia atriviolacea]RSZ55241.1 hypothetical protein EJB06_30415 [Massilia atriviolacea]
MKNHPIPKHGPRFQIDEWIQSALRGELLAIVESDWLDICHIDRVTRSLDELRLLTGMPERTVPREKLHPGVALLHCVRYEEMSKPTLDGLPAALLQVLGLDDQSGPHFLGGERWLEVERRFRAQTEYKLSSADEARSRKGDIGQRKAVVKNSRASCWKSLAYRLNVFLGQASALSSMLHSKLNRRRGRGIASSKEPQALDRPDQEIYEHVHRPSPSRPAVENLINDSPCDAAKQVLADIMRQRGWPHERLITNGMHNLRHRRVPQKPRSPKNQGNNPGDSEGDGCDDADDITA